MAKETKTEVRARFKSEMTEVAADMHALGMIDDATKEEMIRNLNTREPANRGHRKVCAPNNAKPDIKRTAR